MKKWLCLILFLIPFCLASAANAAFVVKKIEFEGLSRVSLATARNYLPIKTGQVLTSNKTGQILRALYKAGFFEHISLERQNQTLIIHVKERPTIGQLKVTGNSIVPTDKLNSVLNSLDIAQGRIYNAAVVERVSQSLLGQYYQLGRYNAHVNVNVTPMPRNRVAVQINISEGLAAKIKRISILGSKAFCEKTLINQLTLTTSGLFTIITQTDRYAEPRLDESIERLRNFYLDHGFLNFEVKSAQAEVTPDKKSVFITIVVNEGEPYTVSKIGVEGSLLDPPEIYLALIPIRPGEIFSRQKIVDGERAISKFLGERGYMFATIVLRPTLDEANHQIALVLDVNPGKRTYVRQITFSENTRTNDIVLRREIQQMEAAPVSTTLLEDSKHRLSLLPFIKEVDMSLKPVPEVDDEVDINYKVKEDSTAQATFKIGYSGTYGFLLGAAFNQKNFLGTGNTLGINFNRSRFEQYYGMEYTDPYYTEDGISRTLSLGVSRVDPGAVANLNSGYAINEIDIGVLYGIPIGQEIGAYNRILVGAQYQNTLIVLNNKNRANLSNQVNTFINRHGRRFQELDLKIGYTRDSRDKAIFPTRGSLQTTYLDLYAPLDSDSLSFYIFNYSGKWYYPLTDQFIFLTRADFGYGNGFHGSTNYPFFKNFYAGGIDSVRGYSGLTLGPRDSNGKAYGGNILVDASIALIFPNYISDSLRTSFFIDAGNVYTSFDNSKYGCNKPANPKNRTCSSNAGPIRFSFGIETDWITPFGPIQLSLARAIRQPHDNLEAFQFALGANF